MDKIGFSATVAAMAHLKRDQQSVRSIRELYPQFDEARLREADENLERYLELGLRIYERICGDSEAYALFKALTTSTAHRKIKVKRSN